MEGFTRDEIILFFQVASAVAWADRVFQPEERELLEELIAEFALPPDLAREVQAILAGPPSLSDADFAGCTPEMKSFFLTMAERVALADGVLDPRETAMVKQLAEWMGVGLDADP
ncbi:MAG: hypothetical protein ABIO70_11815 [Pseudomonadota bacterium]